MTLYQPKKTAEGRANIHDIMEKSPLLKSALIHSPNVGAFFALLWYLERMAIFHFHAQVIKRSAGKSATAAAAYRSGGEIHDDRNDTTHDYTKKGGVEYSEIMTPKGELPDWVNDRGELWNEVEKAERRGDAQLCREFDIALPVELSVNTHKEMIREFAKKQLTDKGMIADYSIHYPTRKEGITPNPHVHIMTTMRTIDANGFGNKNRDWNKKELVTDLRKAWEKTANKHLEEKGVWNRKAIKKIDCGKTQNGNSFHYGKAGKYKAQREGKIDIAYEHLTDKLIKSKKFDVKIYVGINKPEYSEYIKKQDPKRLSQIVDEAKMRPKALDDFAHKKEREEVSKRFLARNKKEMEESQKRKTSMEEGGGQPKEESPVKIPEIKEPPNLEKAKEDPEFAKDYKRKLNSQFSAEVDKYKKQYNAELSEKREGLEKEKNHLDREKKDIDRDLSKMNKNPISRFLNRDSIETNNRFLEETIKAQEKNKALGENLYSEGEMIHAEAIKKATEAIPEVKGELDAVKQITSQQDAEKREQKKQEKTNEGNER